MNSRVGFQNLLQTFFSSEYMQQRYIHVCVCTFPFVSYTIFLHKHAFTVCQRKEKCRLTNVRLPTVFLSPATLAGLGPEDAFQFTNWY